MNPELLWVFIPTIAAISLTPGMCMTLAFTLGLSQGYRRTLWMMWGELAGVATVVSTCVLLLAWIQSLSEVYFAVLALVGGSYLLWIAYRLWTQPARFSSGNDQSHLSAIAFLDKGRRDDGLCPRHLVAAVEVREAFCRHAQGHAGVHRQCTCRRARAPSPSSLP